MYKEKFNIIKINILDIISFINIKVLSMIYKELDSKEESIQTLEKLFKMSQSDKQKKLIQKEIQSLKNGYEGEKQNAYYIDFYLKDSKNVIVLHDIRIEHNKESAQIDHMIISRLGIELIESKNLSGEVSINNDNSLTIKYNNTVKTVPNPLEQSKRHAKVLKDFLEEHIDFGKRIKLLGGIKIDNVVLFHPEVTIANEDLPENFYRADSYISKRAEKIDKMSTSRLLNHVTTMINIDQVKELADLLIQHHKPILYDYTLKYKVPKTLKPETFNENKDNSLEDNKILTVGSPCPFCSNPLVLRNATKEKPFLGCSTFPKCRFTRRVTKELSDEILNSSKVSN